METMESFFREVMVGVKERTKGPGSGEGMKAAVTPG